MNMHQQAAAEVKTEGTELTLPKSAPNILVDLGARGLIHQCSNLESLGNHLATGQRGVYCGFDPTADSLHVGSLVPLLALRRFQLAGHKPIVLVGGATGLIGDPSGKANERTLNSGDIVQEWTDKLKKQVSKFVDLDPNSPAPAEVVNNYEWISKLDAISFLRDVGKHFTVNSMVNRENVKNRFERDTGISFTEFSYGLLQAIDFVELKKTRDCTIQLGGSDQWGNIIGGLDLVRRQQLGQTYGLTLPLVTKADGTKFGKTETATVWLDPTKTSPYLFHQFWLNTADADVEKFLNFFSFRAPEEINEIVTAHQSRPEQRLAQRALANDVTELVHSPEAARAAENLGRALFSNTFSSITSENMALLLGGGVPTLVVKDENVSVTAALATIGLASSKSDARKLIASGAVSVNGEKVESVDSLLNPDKAIQGTYFVIKKGKRDFGVIVRD